MSSMRSTILSGNASRRLRRPTLSFSRIFLILCLGTHAFGQTFQYSRGWTNGRKRASALPSASAALEARKEMASAALSASDSGEFTDDFPKTIQQKSMSGGRVISLGSVDQGKLEALLLLLGNNVKDAGGEDGEELEVTRQKGLEVGGESKKAGWRRNSLGESFLRRRRRRVAVERAVATDFN